MENYIVVYDRNGVVKTNDLNDIKTSSDVSAVIRVSDMCYYAGLEWIPIKDNKTIICHEQI